MRTEPDIAVPEVAVGDLADGYHPDRHNVPGVEDPLAAVDHRMVRDTLEGFPNREHSEEESPYFAIAGLLEAFLEGQD